MDVMMHDMAMPRGGVAISRRDAPRLEDVVAELRPRRGGGAVRREDARAAGALVDRDVERAACRRDGQRQHDAVLVMVREWHRQLAAAETGLALVPFDEGTPEPPEDTLGSQPTAEELAAANGPATAKPKSPAASAAEDIPAARVHPERWPEVAFPSVLTEAGEARGRPSGTG